MFSDIRTEMTYFLR